jgi:S-adenosylmethionine hydrolase
MRLTQIKGKYRTPLHFSSGNIRTLAGTRKEGAHMPKFRLYFYTLLITFTLSSPAFAKVIILQSDFGTRDAAVAAMKIVITGIDKEITIIDNTHEIEPFKVYEGAYRLYQTAPLASAGTVYISVIDPGVGSKRLSIVAKDKRGVIYVTQDNGTLSFIDKEVGLAEVRVIDESIWRRPGSENSHTFHGRDIYAYVGALLASQKVAFEDIGEKLDLQKLTRINIANAEISENKLILSGIVEIHDVRFGNLWTNIPEDLAKAFGFKEGNVYTLKIYNSGKLYKELKLPFLRSFSAAKDYKDAKLIYINSLGKLACAELLGSFAKSQGVGFGPDWTIEILK